MFENIFKKIDDLIWKDSGCDSELDYAEQTSWILFLKWLDDYEKDEKIKSELENKKFKPIFEDEYKWSNWAIKRDSDGKINLNDSLRGPDLIDFINLKLFPYLGNFKNLAENIDTFEYKIGIIFSELRNEIQDGFILRGVLDEVDKLEFRSDEQKHELSVLYESKIQNMGNAGRTGGQYYTPRPLIKTIVKLVNPKIGEVIYDGASGSCGFLVEAFEHIKNSKSLTSTELRKLQSFSLYGKEKKNLAYIIGMMNMILHGIESPNIIRTNTLEENILDIQDKDRVDIVLANPPFGKGEQTQIQENFPLKSSETAYLFLQHFIKKLKIGGRTGIVIKNTFLSNGDAKLLRKELLETCNVHIILDLPSKVFTAGVHTVVLFFEKGKPTKNIWHYELNLDRNLGKTNALNEKDLEEFIKFSKTKQESENSWNKNINNINKDTWDLSLSNPNKVEKVDNRTPEEIISEIEQLDVKAKDSLKTIKELL
ncbi:type I restriction-modification system subunit M [Alphaproteobacteria bacterium]|nr:type I restriction-modification system subunit M [Alphaproteobacteria bacterium]